MSALIAVCGSDAVHILTDAASTGIKTGTLVSVLRKQFITRNGVVIAGIGVWEPFVRFARWADERTSNFDELAEIGPTLWAEACSTLTAEAKALARSLVFAGWSHKNARVDMHNMQEIDGEYQYWTDSTAYVGAPDDNCAELADSFVDRFGPDPNAFDPQRDGLELMEALRRQYPRVGGFVQHTTFSRAGVATEILRHWPDRIGHIIEPSDERVDVNEMRDENFFGMTMAEIYRMREDLVHRMTAPAAPRLTMTDLRKLREVFVARMTPAELAELRG